MSINITRERPDTPDAMALIAELDAHLEPLYASQSRHGFSVDTLIAEQVDFFVLRSNGTPACCGGIKVFGTTYGEIKRMYVRSAFRGSGFGKAMLQHLEAYARTRALPLLRLETGIHQHTAIGLYEQMGFYRIPPFGPYTHDVVSICYEKQLA